MIYEKHTYNNLEIVFDDLYEIYKILKPNSEKLINLPIEDRNYGISIALKEYSSDIKQKIKELNGNISTE